MKARPILMSSPMVRALLDGRKTQTRRVISPENIRFWTGGLDYAGRHIKPDNDLFGHAMREAADFRFHDGVLAWTGAAFDYQAPATRTNWMGRCAYGQPGDLLWVRETAEADDDASEAVTLAKYSADGAPVLYPGPAEDEQGEPDYGACPSIHLPRRFSRLTLVITGVRVERLQVIGQPDAIAEGIEPLLCALPGGGKSDAWRDYGRPNFAEPDPIRSYKTLWESINGPGSWDANPWVWVLSFNVHRFNVDDLLRARAA